MWRVACHRSVCRLHLEGFWLAGGRTERAGHGQRNMSMDVDRRRKMGRLTICREDTAEGALYLLRECVLSDRATLEESGPATILRHDGQTKGMGEDWMQDGGKLGQQWNGLRRW